MTYRRRGSPLHAARAAVAAAWCLALAAAALAFEHPLVLVAVLVAVVLGGAAARVGPELARAALLALPLALLVAVVNPLVARQGLTVLARLGEVPGLGRLDVTLEATAYGGVLGLRTLCVLLAAALLSLAVDPDELLRAFRRLGFRSALTATLATRLVPVLARDGRRLAEARRCRPGADVPRLAVARAVAAGALDRAVDVAATLEVRGYGHARRPPASSEPWSRPDLAFGAGALALLAVTVAGAVADPLAFQAYPRLRAGLGAGEAAWAGAVLVAALAPFAVRRGVAR